MTAGSRCSFLRAACCERIVKWCKLTIKGEKGTRATSEKRKLYASIAYPAWKAFLGEFVEKVGTRGMKRGGEGRGGEGRKENCFLFTVWTGGPKGRDHNFFDGGGGGYGGEGVEKFSHSNIVLYAAPAVNNIFASPSSCKHIYLCLHTIYFSVYSLCKQFISKFSNPPPLPTSSKKIMVHP